MREPRRKFQSLPRLERAWYQGTAFVFWTHTISGRAVGWLNPEFHLKFREALLHTIGRYQLICPAYCLMPDHFHLIWMGCAPQSDQVLASSFFRRQLNLILGNKYSLQRQAHDHVLREKDRERDAFVLTCHYTLENPVRAGLVASQVDYAFLGAAAVGFPDFDPRCEGYWDRLWSVYEKNCGS